MTKTQANLFFTFAWGQQYKESRYKVSKVGEMKGSVQLNKVLIS